MLTSKLRMILAPLPPEREQAYYAALEILAEIIRKEIERTAPSPTLPQIDPSTAAQDDLEKGDEVEVSMTRIALNENSAQTFDHEK